MKRRLLGVWQDRYGPNRVGPFGLLQVVADGIKIFFKEDWISAVCRQAGFCRGAGLFNRGDADVLLPSSHLPPGIGVIDLNIGLLFFLAMSSLSVYSVVLGRMGLPEANTRFWAASGPQRSCLSYEVFMGLSLIGGGSSWRVHSALRAIVESQARALVLAFPSSWACSFSSSPGFAETQPAAV